MANLRIKCGAIEMSATGGAEYIAQESGAFYGFLKHKVGEDLLAAQRRREKHRNAEPEKKTGEAPATCTVAENGDVLQGVRVGTCPETCNMRAFKGMHITTAMLRTNIEAGKLDALLQPFDEIDIPLDTGGTVTVVCGYSDATTARFVFKDCWDEHVMNEENTNKTGYHGSAGRKHVLEDIYTHLTQEWKDIIKPRELVETIDGKEVRYADPMWLPSATDVFGASEDGYWAEEPDSFQLPIFERERDRVKECGDNGTYPWWLRSVYASYTYYFRIVRTSGGSSDSYACASRGFAPGFDI